MNFIDLEEDEKLVMNLLNKYLNIEFDPITGKYNIGLKESED